MPQDNKAQPELKIKIEQVYDPLTRGSYLNPTAPWVGVEWDIDSCGRVTSRTTLELARLERLIKDYVAGSLSGCSVLIGGDRGAGKTSLVLKALERQRSSWIKKPPDIPLDESGSPECTLQEAPKPAPPVQSHYSFPRPFLVRVHGPKLFDVEPTDHPPRNAMRLIAESLCRALADEYGELFQLRAQNPQKLEEAAQFRMELDEGPTSYRIREMWATFSKRSDQLESILEEPGKGSTTAQAMKEILALATAVQLCQEIRKHKSEADEQENSREKKDKPQAPNGREARAESSEDRAFWRLFSRFMLDGGKLIHPLAGLFVGALTFFSLLRSSADLPVALFTAFLSGFTTTILLNFAAAKNRYSSMLPDASLASLDRTLPSLLRRIEEAGLYPIIVVDELDKQEDEDRDLDKLVRDLKYFVADQAFVCFLTGRSYYDKVVKENAKEASQREKVATFFTERILVSHTPDSLMKYLDKVLILEEVRNPGPNSSAPAGQSSQSVATAHLSTDSPRKANKKPSPSPEARLTFLKYYYLYRAKGHLADLSESIARDHKHDGTVHFATGEGMHEVPVYMDQVLYQLSVHAALSDPATLRTIRVEPDHLEALNRVLYEPARIWEEQDKDSFLLDEILGTGGDREVRETYKYAVDTLLDYLRHSIDEWRIEQTEHRGQLIADWHILSALLCGPIPLLKPDLKQGENRHFWTRPIHYDQKFVRTPLDKPEIIKFRSQPEYDFAMRRLKSLSALVEDLTRGEMTVLDLADIPGLLQYTRPHGMTWADLSWPRPELPESAPSELAIFHAAITARINEIRWLLYLSLISVRSNARQVSRNELEQLALQAASGDGAVDYTLLDTSVAAAEEHLRASISIKQDLRDLLNSSSGSEDITDWTREAHFLLNRLRALPPP
ncbi:MAG: ATP-binding protein [Acidobacteria bacterium]|nr:ATP-binding protein [Acidobacteriota bacterium]